VTFISTRHIGSNRYDTGIVSITVACALVLGLVVSQWCPVHAQESEQGSLDVDVPEYALKAAFIYNFAKFVTWPDSGFKDDDSPFVIGMIGINPFGGVIEDMLRDRSVEGRPFILRNIVEVEDARACQILFIAESESRRLEQWLRAVRGYPVLTIGDTKSFAERGCIVNLKTTTEGRVRFEVNIDEVPVSGLPISSRLLTLADIVHNPQER
jgi:hypothetical protein